MSWKSFIYRALKYSNDVNAVQKAISTKSTRPLTRRVGRRLYGRATSKIARNLFR